MKAGDYEHGSVEVRGKRVSAERITGTNFVLRDVMDPYAKRLKASHCGPKVTSTFIRDPHCIHGITLVSRPDRPSNYCPDCEQAGGIVNEPKQGQ